MDLQLHVNIDLCVQLQIEMMVLPVRLPFAKLYVPLKGHLVEMYPPVRCHLRVLQ